MKHHYQQTLMAQMCPLLAEVLYLYCGISLYSETSLYSHL